jgi:enoyl-[acyl-carrier protein] reductase I
MSFLNLTDRKFLVFGVANRKSVAWAVGRILEDEGAQVIYSVRSEDRRESLQGLLGDRKVYICDVEKPEEITALANAVGKPEGPLDGIVHSIAFARFREGHTRFHETQREDFLQSVTVSAFSLVEIAAVLKPYLARDASVVTIGISSDTVTAENYGYLSPVKSALSGCVRNLAKSFSDDTRIRFNAVNAGPLKTSASAGIPGYLESYLYAESLTFRKEAVNTDEVANCAAFLLSERSSGINGQGLVVNAGMDFNYFDRDVIRLAMRPDRGSPSTELRTGERKE